MIGGGGGGRGKGGRGEWEEIFAGPRVENQPYSTRGPPRGSNSVIKMADCKIDILRTKSM